MKLERNALKSLIRESLQEIVNEEAPSGDAAGGGAGPGDFEVTGAGASAVNTMLTRLKAQKPVMSLLEPMRAKHDALLAVAAIAYLLQVDIKEHTARLGTLQASIKVAK